MSDNDTAWLAGVKAGDTAVHVYGYGRDTMSLVTVQSTTAHRIRTGERGATGT